MWGKTSSVIALWMRLNALAFFILSSFEIVGASIGLVLSHFLHPQRLLLLCEFVMVVFQVLPHPINRVLWGWSPSWLSKNRSLCHWTVELVNLHRKNSIPPFLSDYQRSNTKGTTLISSGNFRKNLTHSLCPFFFELDLRLWYYVKWYQPYRFLGWLKKQIKIKALWQKKW